METQSATGLAHIPEDANKYEILGVGQDATEVDLRVAYRRLALLYHPDRHPEEERKAAGEIFRRIAAAYETLSRPAERRRYDLALSRNEEFKETSGDAHEIPLTEILAGIDAYEHIFSEGSLRGISEVLDQIVQKSLIGELGEQIVEAWPLPAAPSGSTHRGSFEVGALVLTNLRVLLPYTFTWQETHGNIRTTYTGAAMPTLVLPLLECIAVVTEKRVRRKLWVDFHHEGGNIRIRPRQTNLSKLLLVAQLWGVPVEARQEDARSEELRWALLRPWQWAAGLIAVLMVGTAVLGIFSGGVLDNTADLADFFRRWGIWQWIVFLYAAVSARRLWRWVFAYSAIDMADTIRTQEARPAGVSTNLQATSASGTS